MTCDQHDPTVQALIALGEQHDEIRAVVLTSSQANGTADILSDYDAELFVTDLARFADHDDWFESFGPVLVMLRLPHEDGPGFTRLVQYQSGLRIDFQVTVMRELEQLCAAPELPDGYDTGYAVLLDKDGITADLAPPAFRAFIPAPPTAEEFAANVDSFWWNSVYLPKALWRGDVLPAAHWLNAFRQEHVRVMLDWCVEIDRNWSWKTGTFGKGLTKALDREMLRELAATCGGGDVQALWGAFFSLIALYEKSALRVADARGFTYPSAFAARVTAYHRVLSTLDPQCTSREELAWLLEESYARLDVTDRPRLDHPEPGHVDRP